MWFPARVALVVATAVLLCLLAWLFPERGAALSQMLVAHAAVGTLGLMWSNERRKRD
jgi:hypothetical protein